MNEIKIREIEAKTGIKYNTLWKYLNQAELSKTKKNLKIIKEAGFDISPFLFGKGNK